MKLGALLAIMAACCSSDVRSAVAAVGNIASHGTPIMGVAVDGAGTHDVLVANAGPIGEIIDGVSNANLAANAYNIGGNGASGANGNGADTFAAAWPDYQFDYVGVLFAEPQFGVSSIRVQNYLANDGGWWGPTSVVSGGSPLAFSDLLAPQVQVTLDGGATWTNVLGATNNYAALYTGRVRGTGFPNATSGPFATFSFAPQNGINGIRLIGEGAGPADGSGFVGINEFEAIGTPQVLQLEVNVSSGRVRLVNVSQNPIAFDFYRIDSPSGALDIAAGGWNSLERPGLNPTGFPSGNGSGDGWENLGTPSTKLAAESFLQGASTLAAGEFVSLGALFGGSTQDLSLRYRTAGGQFINVAATYASLPDLSADFNDDDIVDGEDLQVWRDAFGLTNFADSDGDGVSDGADFLIWQRQFNAPARGEVATHAVPEPGTALIFLCGLASPLTAGRQIPGGLRN